MSEQTKIQWCDSTINFWSGCTMVRIEGGLKKSGCLHCYAKARDDRQLQEKQSHWGKGAPRLKSVGAVKQALTFNRKPWVCDECGEGRATESDYQLNTAKLFCKKCGPSSPHHRRTIFSLSLGDWLDDEVPIAWLAEMLDTIRKCDQVTWILCTKRPENFTSRLQAATTYYKLANEPFFIWSTSWWLDGKAPPNIILLTSVENQAAADLRIPQLLQIPAARHGLSLEPLLGPVDLHKSITGNIHQTAFNAIKNQLHWLIIGGESGPGARECNVDWIRALVEHGKAAGVPTFVKQLGANPFLVALEGGQTVINENIKLRDPKGGDMSEWPEDLRVRELPRMSPAGQ